MLIRDKIYNMTEFNTNSEPHADYTYEQAGHDPVSVGESMDTLVEQLATSESLQAGFDWMRERQNELYDRARALRQEKKSLPPAEEQELDDIHNAMLTIQTLYDRYHNTE